MNPFLFPIDEQGTDFCHDIAREMVMLFNIPEEEAVGRINRDFKRVTFIGPELIFYNETPTFWAKDIYFGHHSFWWRNEKGTKPRPYPAE